MASRTPSTPASRPAGTGAAIGFLTLGLVFQSMAVSSGQSTFFGVGTAFLTLGVVFLGTSRKRGA